MKKLFFYGVTGIINTALYYGLFVWLARLIDYRMAVVISYCTAIFVSYLLNGALVFRARGSLVKFVALNLLLMLVNLCVTWGLVDVWHWRPETALLGAIVIVFMLGFFLNKRYVFVARPPAAREVD